MFLYDDDIINYVLVQRTNGDQHEYYNTCLIDANYIAQHVAPVKSILDIGCGVAGVDVILHRNLPGVKFWLVDKEDNTQNQGSNKYGFKDADRFYNKTDITKKFLELNAADMDYVAQNDFDGIESVDAIISTVSYCWHYPLDTYLHEVTSLLNPTGKLLVDIRNEREKEVVSMLTDRGFKSVLKSNAFTTVKDKGHRYIFQKARS